MMRVCWLLLNIGLRIGLRIEIASVILALSPVQIGIAVRNRSAAAINNAPTHAAPMRRYGGDGRQPKPIVSARRRSLLYAVLTVPQASRAAT